jgi:hypothetical protein
MYKTDIIDRIFCGTSSSFLLKKGENKVEEKVSESEPKT